MIDLLDKRTHDLIRAFYDTTARHYHTFAHIEDGLIIYHDILDKLEDPKAFLLAWLFHDVIYDTENKSPFSNEMASASLMEGIAHHWKIPESIVKTAKNLILSTQHLKVEPQTSDEKYFVDLDLSILGRDQETFLGFDQAVRKEFSHLSDKEWAKGRRAFLSALNKENLFHTEYFNDRYGRAAKRNISNYLK